MAMVKDVFSTKWKQLVKIVAHSQLTWQRVRQSKVCWSSASMTATVSPSLSKSVMVWISSLSTIYSNERIKGNGMWIESIKNVLTVNSLSLFFALSAVNQVEKKKNAATLIFYFTCNSLKSSSNWRSWRQSFRWEACLFQNSSSVLCVSSIWINSLGITKNCTNYNSFLLSGLKTELKGDNDNQTTKKYLSTVVMLTSWPAQGSHRRPGVERGAGFLIKFRRVSPCALALFNSVLRLAYSCPWCCRTAWVLCTSLGSSVSWRRRENLRSAAPMSAVFAEKLSTD